MRQAELQSANDRLAFVNRSLVEQQPKLVQAEKLAALGMLAGGVAHEVNNPLSGMMGCVKFLRSEQLSPEARSQYCDAIQDGLRRIEGTVRGLVDYARKEPQMPEPLDVADVVSSCLKLVVPAASDKRVEVVADVAAGGLGVRADRSQIMQAIINVLVNAVQASPSGSVVSVRSARVDGRVGIRVGDRGRGIPPELVSRVTDPFFTTRDPGEGTGLGLSIALGIAHAHGGDLEIDSQIGQGTQVTLWFPLDVATAS
jgi:signal transduction histidine kinase